MALPRNDLGPFFVATAEIIYVGTNQSVVALDAATGERFRIADPPDDGGGQIALVDGTLYRRTGLQTVTAYDPATRRERWTYRHPVQRARRRPALVQRARRRARRLLRLRRAERGAHRRLLAVDAADGHERWRAPRAAYIALYQDMPVRRGRCAHRERGRGRRRPLGRGRLRALALSPHPGPVRQHGRSARLHRRPLAALAALARHARHRTLTSPRLGVRAIVVAATTEDALMPTYDLLIVNATLDRRDRCAGSRGQRGRPRRHHRGRRRPPSRTAPAASSTAPGWCSRPASSTCTPTPTARCWSTRPPRARSARASPPR